MEQLDVSERIRFVSTNEGAADNKAREIFEQYLKITK
jgi:hypothetical protein